jgi:hypothetical protein
VRDGLCPRAGASAIARTTASAMARPRSSVPVQFEARPRGSISTSLTPSAAWTPSRGDLVRAENDDEMLTAVGEEFFAEKPGLGRPPAPFQQMTRQAVGAPYWGNPAMDRRRDNLRFTHFVLKSTKRNKAANSALALGSFPFILLK